MRLSTLLYGSAAGCAARLCLAGEWERTLGSAPGTAFGLTVFGASPEPRAKPILFSLKAAARQSRAAHRAAKPRCTSGGKATPHIGRQSRAAHRAAKPRRTSGGKAAPHIGRQSHAAHRAAKPRRTSGGGAASRILKAERCLRCCVVAIIGIKTRKPPGRLRRLSAVRTVDRSTQDQVP